MIYYSLIKRFSKVSISLTVDKPLIEITVGRTIDRVKTWKHGTSKVAEDTTLVGLPLMRIFYFIVYRYKLFQLFIIMQQAYNK
jgi:hypothetical protein